MTTTGGVTALEDVRALEALVYRYARLCDDSYNPDGLAALFAEDAVWRAGSADGAVDFGEHRGREAIREFFAGVSADLVRTVHYVMKPELDIAPDGRTASGHWCSLTLMERASGPPGPIVLAGTYDHEYVKVDDAWLFARLVGNIVFEAPLQAAAA
jgi:hypothetical protein